MKKRILSLLLAAAMALAMAPLSAFAAEPEAGAQVIGGADGPTSILVSDQGGQAGTPPTSRTRSC